MTSSEMGDSIDSLNVSVASIAYYLYRLAGCPYGDSISGWTAWLDVQKEVFEKLVEPIGEDDATP